MTASHMQLVLSDFWMSNTTIQRLKADKDMVAMHLVDGGGINVMEERKNVTQRRGAEVPRHVMSLGAVL